MPRAGSVTTFRLLRRADLGICDEGGADHRDGHFERTKTDSWRWALSGTRRASKSGKRKRRVRRIVNRLGPGGG